MNKLVMIIAVLVMALFMAGCTSTENGEPIYTPEQTSVPTPEAPQTIVVTPASLPTRSIEEIKSSAKIISYDDLFRYNERYVGDIVYFRGDIVEVQNTGGDNYVLRVATAQYYDDIIWVDYEGPRVLEDDNIDIWGTVKGLKSYEAVLGQTISIPEIVSISLDVNQNRATKTTPIFSADPEITEFLAALEDAEALKNKVFYEYGGSFKFSLPYDYTSISYRNSADQDVKRELRDVDGLKKDFAAVYTKASNAKPPKEYAMSKAKLMAGIELYQYGVNYLKSSYDMYLNEDTYTAIQNLFNSAETSFLDGDDYFVESRNLLP